MFPHARIESVEAFASANTVALANIGTPLNPEHQIVVLSVSVRGRGGDRPTLQCFMTDADGGTFDYAEQRRRDPTAGDGFEIQGPIAFTPGNRVSVTIQGLDGAADFTSCGFRLTFVRVPRKP